jgi:hypothetical protein
VSQEQFESVVGGVAEAISGRALEAGLEDFLNENYPPGGEVFDEISGLCRQGISEGWLCNHEHGGIKFGRIVKADTSAREFSVDVVEMDDVVGPQHRHPSGEIDMIIPESPEARFDGRGEGWLVYQAGSAHAPTVTGGRAIILYLLPQGDIEFAAGG